MCRREEDIDGEGCRGGRTQRRGAEKILVALLLHLPRPFFQRWPNAVVPRASRSSLAELAMTNKRERREERLFVR
jgi:hypothetical protein